MQFHIFLTCLFAALLLEAKHFPRVRIFNPKQGSVWKVGDYKTIVWRKAYIPPPPDPPALNITLRRKGDLSFRLPIAVNVPLDDLQYTWKVPSWLPTHDDYVIRLLPERAFPKPGRPNIQASKSKPFTILGSGQVPTVSVVSPTPTTVWYGGQYRYIQWSLKNAPEDSTISIYVYEPEGFAGPKPYLIASGLSTSTSTSGSRYRWQIPYEFRTSDSYVITVKVIGADGSTLTQNVSPAFKINQVGDAGHGTPTVVPVA